MNEPETRNSSISTGTQNGGRPLELENKIPGIVREMLHHRITLGEARELSVRLETFPAIKTAVRANIYLSAIPILHNQTPASDKLDDYRHVIEASYTEVFATADEQLARTIPRLNPSLEVFRWMQDF